MLYSFNFLFINRVLKKYHGFQKKISSTTVFNTDINKKCLLSSKSSIRMISEGSCDTEDWSNDAENSALPSQE